MFKTTSLLTKFVLAVLVLGLGLVALPVSGVGASAGLTDEANPPSSDRVSNERLEKAWARVQTAYTRQGERLDKADEFIARVQTLIEKASARGWDPSAVQAALDAFAAVIPAAQAAHEPGAAIVASHAGFDENGKVTDRAAAIETVKSLGQVLKDTHAAMNGTGEALREAIRAMFEAHGGSESPALP
jgi:hypothetical protein